MKTKKVALVCDWLTEKGGAEDVLLELHKLFPEAPIYTSQYRKRRIGWFKDTEVRTGWLNYFPVFSRRFIAPLRQIYFKNLDLSEYDLVISVTGCDAKFIKTNGIHLCFCHVPTQYYWGKYDEYIKDPGFGVLNPVVKAIFKRMAPKLRQNDLEAASRPDKYITISNYAKSEIKKHYKREAKVVNPPVKTEIFTGVNAYKEMERGKSQMAKQHNKTIKSQESQAAKSEQKFYTKLETVENLSILAYLVAKYKDGFYVNFSRQVNWKRLDLIVKCCKKLKLPLVMIGNGPENRRLRKLAKGADDYITFVDFLPKTDLAVISSLAKAFVFPSEEPFGIAPIEALAAGCPVIALKAGGALDYIKDGKNGIFFKDQTEESLEKALKKFEQSNISLDSPAKIQKSVEKYSSESFQEKMKAEIDQLVGKKPADENALSKQSRLKKIKTSMILFLPLILFFSNFPLINFGDASSMNLKVNLPLLFIAAFSILSIKDVLEYFKKHLKTPLIALPVALILSLIHTSNPLRGILTFITLSCLVTSFLGIYLHIKEEKLPKNFRKIFIVESVVISAVCLLQALFDRLGVSRDLTLLCVNCTKDTFGFPHPNGFAIEPQFMGTLLIVPIFVVLNSLLENKNKKCQIKLAIAVILIATTLFFTFSRGAIYATMFALLLLILGLRNLKKALMIISITVASFMLSLGLQISLSTTSPKDTVNTVISQLSLGKISLKSEEETLNKEFDEPAIETSSAEVSEKAPFFSGYVVESTNRRLELATFALNISTKNPTNLIFGTGLGSAGVEMYHNFPERQGHEKEIVQNQYLEALLEFGLFGVTMLILSLVTFIKLERIKLNIYMVSIVAAFAITLMFFSGLPSAIHIYLLPVLWYNNLYDKNRLS